MRLAFVSQAYPPDTATGGIGTQTRLKARGMAARGHDVWVVAMGTAAEPIEQLDGPVRVLRVPSPLHDDPELTESGLWRAWSAAVAETLRELHAHTALDLVDFPEYGGEGHDFSLERLDPWVSMTVQVHGPLAMLAETIGWPEPGSELLRVGLEMEGTALRRADLVYSSSALSADWVAHAHGVDRSAIDVLHVGVDTERFRPGLAPRHVRPTVVYVGAISESKGAFVLLDAVLRAAETVPGLRVRMLGRGTPKVTEELRRRADEAGRPAVLDLAGYVGHDQLPHELCRGHVLALPSRYEGGPGLVLLEAMACGLPVIACAGSGAAEAVAPGVSGLLVPPDDPEALAQALVALAQPARREAMAARALAYARAEASCVPRLDRLEELLAGVVDARVVV
jgi:glycosyltransferase involved in cell wall biosynthesis